MVGKAARRPRLHLAAPKLPTKSLGQAAAEEGAVAARRTPEKIQAFLPSNIFAGVKIDPKTLVKKLDADSRSIVAVTKELPGVTAPFLSVAFPVSRFGVNFFSQEAPLQKQNEGTAFLKALCGKHLLEHNTSYNDVVPDIGDRGMAGEEEKVPLSKKEKMKLRKERWLQKIEDIKLAKKLQKAEAKRKATPVVGDMNPLMEALPELSDLVTISKFSKHPKIQVKKMVTNFTQMKSAQKRKVLEDDVAQFHKMLSNPLYKASPLTVIGECLSKRLKQEKEGEPL